MRDTGLEPGRRNEACGKESAQAPVWRVKSPPSPAGPGGLPGGRGPVCVGSSKLLSAGMGAVQGSGGGDHFRGGEMGGITRKGLKIKGNLVQGHKDLTDRILGAWAPAPLVVLCVYECELCVCVSA